MFKVVEVQIDFDLDCRRTLFRSYSAELCWDFVYRNQLADRVFVFDILNDMVIPHELLNSIEATFPEEPCYDIARAFEPCYAEA
jgi:hypothetical protein